MCVSSAKADRNVAHCQMGFRVVQPNVLADARAIRIGITICTNLLAICSVALRLDATPAGLCASHQYTPASCSRLFCITLKAESGMFISSQIDDGRALTSIWAGANLHVITTPTPISNKRQHARRDARRAVCRTNYTETNLVITSRLARECITRIIHTHSNRNIARSHIQFGGPTFISCRAARCSRCCAH